MMRTVTRRVSAIRLAGVATLSLLLVAATHGPWASAPIADAAMRGDINTVRELLKQKADVNAAQGDGMTALHWAAERGDIALANVLLGAKANVKAVTRINAYTPLHIASKSGASAVVSALLKAGSDPNAVTLSGATALHFAALSGDVATATELLENHANPNAKETEWGQTPLMFAADANRGDVIRVLMKHGADASIHSRSISAAEATAQEQAATRKRNEVLTSFLPQKVRDSIKGATPPPPNPPGAGAPDGVTNQNAGQAGGQGQGGQGGGGGRGGGTPPTEKLTPTQIQQAIEAGREALKNAPTRPAEDDTTDGQVAGYSGTVGNMGGMTALHHAARQGNVAAAMALVESGAAIDAPMTSDPTTPLLLATINGQYDVAMALIEKGANVNAQSTAGATPLYTTINIKWAPKSRFPQSQAPQNQKASYLDVMQALIKRGADVNVRLKQNLWYFGYNNCGNANCGLENLEGTTPFWRAVYSVDVEAMKMLVAAGADWNVPSQRNPAAAGGGRGGRGGRGGGRGGAGADSAQAAGAGPGRGGRQGRGGAAGAAADSSQGGRAFAGGGGGGGRGGGAPAGPPLDPAIDSAAKAVPPGIGVYPIHCAAGVGYGNGFAGNSHVHAPDGWMPAMKYLVEELHADVNQRDVNGYTALHHAAARGDNEMILYLVSKGADPKAVARNGRTTVDMANGPVQRLRPFPETIALLEKLGAHNSHRCVGC